MSRNLYTTAVVAPPLERDLIGRLERGDVHGAERRLLSRVESSHREVAQYAAVLDGWNPTHHCIGRALEGCDPLIREWPRLAGPGWLRFDGGASCPGSLDWAKADAFLTGWFAENLGLYAARQLLYALDACLSSAHATGCAGLVMTRGLGPIIGDEEFRATPAA